jgi:hypothetical protein
MSIVWWSKTYISFKKQRLTLKEKALELGLNIFLATLFTIGFIDLFFTIPKIIALKEILIQAVVNGG